MDAVTHPPVPVNEPVLDYAPGSTERGEVEAALKELQATPYELTMTIDGQQRMAAGEAFDVVQPHRHEAVLGTGRQASTADVAAAVEGAVAAGPMWRELPFDERAAVLLRAAALVAGPWRARIVAATMLGQSKTAFQAEIDAACEFADFLRFNVAFARDILTEQPESSAGVWNRMDHRPLEGFVLAISPFNFTAIAGNLPLAPALMGNTVVWKPSPTQQLAAHMIMQILQAAGLPPGVINMVTGDGHAVSDVAVPDPRLAGIHFTGSTKTFQHLWSAVGANIASYRTYPRLVGETGGKDFVFAHPSAEPEPLTTALLRGAFEYQGQKCSAASRAYVPRSLWDASVCDGLAAGAEGLSYGDVTDLSNFGGAVIDRRAYDRLSGVQEMARADADVQILAGGTASDAEGFFVRPTVVTSANPEHQIFTTEYFGPFLGVHVYEDAAYADALAQAADAAPYALTGSIFATDRRDVEAALRTLRFSAGNVYINDKPTGAVVGQQPFGGARASGTNDKAGSPLNLLRWTSPRTIKETFVPAVTVGYPHQG